LSAIQAEEVLALVSEAWGVAPEAIGEGRGAWQRVPTVAFSDKAFAAKACFLMLVRRHTSIGWHKIGNVLGRSLHNSGYCERVIGNFERYARKHDDVRARVEAIEQKIDEIHEARISENVAIPVHSLTLLRPQVSLAR
jgi:predicted transcriptional regulator